MPSLSNQNQLQNPFNEHDLIIPLLELDTDFVSTRKKSFTALYQRVYKARLSTNPSIFMTINNLFHKFTLATLSLSLLMVLTLTTITAQAFAPEEYKPSTIVSNLFAANKQPDKDPTTQLAPNSILAQTDLSLSPDDDNYVANLEGCDLAIKYPKKIEEINTRSSGGQNSYSIYMDDQSDVSYVYNQINCQTPSIRNAIIGEEQGDFSYFKTKDLPSMTKMTKEELQKETGWLITAANIENIYSKVEKYDASKYPRKGSPSLEELKKIQEKESLLNEKYGELSAIEYYFTYNSVEYLVTFYTHSKLLTPQSVQLQFNSLVTNKFSPELVANNQSFIKNCSDLFYLDASVEDIHKTATGCGMSVSTTSGTFTFEYQKPDPTLPAGYDITKMPINQDETVTPISVEDLPVELGQQLKNIIILDKIHFYKGFVFNIYQFVDDQGNIYKISFKNSEEGQAQKIINEISSPKKQITIDFKKDCTKLFSVKYTPDAQFVRIDGQQYPIDGCSITVVAETYGIFVSVYYTENGQPSTKIPSDYLIKKEKINISDLPKVLDAEFLKKINPNEVYRMYTTENVSYQFIDTNNNTFSLFDESGEDQIKINYIK